MKIILASDGTQYGDAACEMMSNFNLGTGDAIKIISVVDMALPMSIDLYGGYLPDTTEMEKVARENAAKIVERSIATVNTNFADRGVEISGEVLFGSPDSRIVETAEEIGADLIIIGSHGYKKWERLLLGSVSNSVVHHAHCSVMVVRSRPE